MTASFPTHETSARFAPRTLRILLIEDNPADIALVRYVLHESAIPHSITVVYEGERALETLDRIKAQGHHQPDLILLDINLPRYSGFQILRLIRSIPALDSAIVNMLTSSQLEADVDAAYRLGANAYTWKESNFDRACDLLTRMFMYWSSLFSELVPNPGT